MQNKKWSLATFETKTLFQIPSPIPVQDQKENKLSNQPEDFNGTVAKYPVFTQNEED